MPLIMVGVSHRDASLDVISRLARAERGLAARLVRECDAIAGAVTLSTCNRFEVYVDAVAFHDAIDTTTALVAELAGLPGAEAEEIGSLRVIVGTSVAQHLFSVASGLESMVVGEDEIAGQVREALAAGQADGTMSPALERLLQRALSTSKAVTSSTGLGAAGRSVVTVALDIVEARHGSVVGKRALLIGTGAYARVVGAALSRRGAADIVVYSSSGRAAEFAASHGYRAVAEGALAEEIAAAELVAACSGASHEVVDQEALRWTGPDRSGALPVLDLALTPDVSDGVRALEWVDVVDLEVIREHAPEEHATAMIEAEEIVLAAVEDFEHRERGRAADSAVVAMRSHVMTIINDEIDRIRGRVDDETLDEVARSLHRVSRSLLHTPSVRAKELARTGDVEDYRRAVRTLFGIDIDARDRD